MSETLTDEHHDWVARVLEVDPRTYPAAPGNGAEPSGGGILDDIKEAVSDAASTVKEKAEAAVDAVADTAKAVGEKVGEAAKAVEETVDGMVKKVKEAFTPPPPVKPGEAGPAQKDRADKLLKGMPPEDQEKVKKLLDEAAPQEKGYLQKALAS